jgi:hypothetical protein
MVDKKPINIISSYGMEIKGLNRVFLDTVNIYRSAISLCIKIFNDEWNDISAYKSKSRLNYAESLIHSTSKNKAKCPEFDFDNELLHTRDFSRELGNFFM